MRVVSPVPYCPPLPKLERLQPFTRFRTVPRRLAMGTVDVHYPRFAVGLGSSLEALEGDTYYLAIRRLVDRLRREQPFDLIHANRIYPDGVAAYRLARRYDVPFVVTEHAPWNGWMDRRAVARQALPAANAAAAIIAPSTYAAETIEPYAPAAKVRVVPPGVDGTEFPLTPAGSRRSDQILFVGFVNFNKGLDVLLRAVQVLRRRGASGKLVVVGGAHYRRTEREGAELVALAATLGVSDRVEFLGRRPPEEVARLMGESAAVVLPSRAESFGSVLVEALACGTPVVATRCGGPEDVVVDTVGELVPVGDHEALAEALTRVLARRTAFDPEALRDYALSRFGIRTVVDRTLEIYADALPTVAARVSLTGIPAVEARST